MSGHNRWTQIKRQKGKTDAEKSKVFGKFSRLITEEAKKTAGNLSAPSLVAAIDRAKAANMPNDVIDRAVKKATLDKSAALEAILYESYGPGGCGIIISTLTSNKNKAAQEVKFILGKHGSSLAGMGSVTWGFERQRDGTWKPTTMTPLSDEDAEKLGALVEELESNDEVQEVFTNAE
ncbi:MAG TPA: YebC/PmpR family DNA-binding transcriptional regulator [Candidatus Paceibacterota bacterium]